MAHCPVTPMEPEDLTENLPSEIGATFQLVRDLVQSAVPEATERVYPRWHRVGYHQLRRGTVSKGKKHTSVDEYLSGLSTRDRAALERLRKAIRAAAPEAEEGFSYGMPAFRIGGKLVAGFAAAASHCAYYPMSGSTIATLAEELAGYETSKGAVRFAADRGLPDALVRKLVKTRIAELVKPTDGAKSPRARSAREAEGPRRRAKARS